ncbi:hypothetical protein DCS32_14075 [Dokdonia sp. Dokd-P16]|uniref:DUF6155 family protein n=1 Tax=Dokdonia sp. Dokd-P16 TaxID=2173169 RepID=UPI000D5492B3|nr:DUF6155 family protein [Dokdonia sp. Dokd-P16]AWH75250.1 hypothetical protein DCS32_14075 [Dokdonia sp. Dokd-P16]
MSKRALKKQISTLSNAELQEQIMELYERIPEVKTYYDFVFNPKEDKLVDEAKIKISNEYFPTRRKRPRKRRSIAQKYIKHFKTLGMNPLLLSDVMIFNIEIAQTFEQSSPGQPDAFYKSMLNSFKELVQYVTYHHLLEELGERLERIVALAEEGKWPNADLFDEAADPS